MDHLQSFQGTLNSGFVGNIIYHMNLEREYEKLSILLVHDKEYFSHIANPDSSDNNKPAPDMENRIKRAYQTHYGKTAGKSVLDEIMASMKTEIQIAALIDGRFIGNIHRPGTEKELSISREDASFGCLPCKQICGMLEIVVNVYNILEDQTSYTIEIQGE